MRWGSARLTAYLRNYTANPWAEVIHAENTTIRNAVMMSAIPRGRDSELVTAGLKVQRQERESGAENRNSSIMSRAKISRSSQSEHHLSGISREKGLRVAMLETRSLHYVRLPVIAVIAEDWQAVWPTYEHLLGVEIP